ncbi:MAG: hypothetical protein Q8891_06450 [Bacteroidota bacterium]|nr:hypothetical protein [Bacteroidota bacterium]
MLATLSTHKLLPAIYEENISLRQKKQLAYKPMQALHEGNIVVQEITKPRPYFSSLALAMPFQPSMWNEKSIHSVFNNVIEIVKTKLNGRYSEGCSIAIVTRLEKLFAQLNFNTHRKSLAIILSPDDEKLFYFNFPVKSVVFSSRFVSPLDLAVNIDKKADFYLLVLENDMVRIYEYNNNLKKIFEQSSTANEELIFKNVSFAIGLLNGKDEKPFIVTGSPNMVEKFCNSAFYTKQLFTLLYETGPFTNDIINSLVTEISNHWDYWHLKFIAGQVVYAQKNNTLISNVESVLQALRKNEDGLLLVDRHLKHQLQSSLKTNSIIFQLANDLIHQIEKFLTRGNRIEITETRLLKDKGGIALLRNTTNGVSGLPLYKSRREIQHGGELF